MPSQAQMSSLPGLPRTPMDSRQQLEALRRVQAQAEQRVKLGMQLFKAAESHTSQHRAMIQQIRQEQQRFQDQINEDVGRSMRNYDEWIGRIDENVTTSIEQLEHKLDELAQNWSQTEKRVEQMISRAEALLDQSRLLAHGASEPTATVHESVGPPPDDDATSAGTPDQPEPEDQAAALRSDIAAPVDISVQAPAEARFDAMDESDDDGFEDDPESSADDSIYMQALKKLRRQRDDEAAA